MSILSDMHECRWKQMYHDEVKSHQEFRRIVEDYLRLTPDEFLDKHPVVKFDPPSADKPY